MPETELPTTGAEADALTVQGVQNGQLVTDEVLRAQKTNKQETQAADKLATQAAQYESKAAQHDQLIQEATAKLLDGEGDPKTLGEQIQREAAARDEARTQAETLRAQEKEHRGLAQEAQTQLDDLMQQGMNELRRQSLSQAVANNLLSMETIEMQAAAKQGGVAAAYKNQGLKDRKVKRYISDFSRRTGVEVRFEKLGPGIEAYYDRESGQMVLSSKLDGASAVKAVSVHELTHHLEGTAGYEEYAKFVLEGQYGSDEAALAEAIARTTEAYARAGIELDEDGARRELVAQATRELVYADETALDRMVRTDRNAVQRIYDGIKDFVKDLGVDKNSPQYADIRKAQTLFEKALNEKNTLAGGEGENAELPKIQFSIEKSFYQQIDEVQKGTFPRYDEMYVSDTPPVLQNLGIQNLPVLMSPNKLKLVMAPVGVVNGKNQHGLTIKQLGQLPKAMEQPLAVIGSKSKPGRIVVMTSLTDSKGNSMIVPVELDAKGHLKGEYVDAHIATSVYGKKGAANLLEQAAADNEVYYVDAKKCRSFGWDAELQLLGSIPKNGYIRTIPQTATNVNTQSTQGGGKDASGKQFSVEQDGNEAGISEAQETTNEVQQTGDENNGIMKAQPGDADFVGPVKPEDNLSSENHNSLINPNLLHELSERNEKFNAEDVVAIAKNKEGQIIWLENGKGNAGLLHILGRHKKEFAERGVSENKIPEYLLKAVSEGKIIGYQGRSKTRPIFEFEYDGETQHVAITIGSNGFIVGANPCSVKKKEGE